MAMSKRHNLWFSVHLVSCLQHTNSMCFYRDFQKLQILASTLVAFSRTFDQSDILQSQYQTEAWFYY